VHALDEWWDQIAEWRAKNCLHYEPSAEGEPMKPQYALDRLRELTRDHSDLYYATEVGQHQMWAVRAKNYSFQIKLGKRLKKCLKKSKISVKYDGLCFRLFVPNKIKEKIKKNV
jgi:hypothetical protein